MLTGFLISDKILILAAGNKLRLNYNFYPHSEQINLSLSVVYSIWDKLSETLLLGLIIKLFSLYLCKETITFIRYEVRSFSVAICKKQINVDYLSGQLITELFGITCRHFD